MIKQYVERLRAIFKLTDPTLVPTTSTDTSPPSFLAAVRALRVTGESFSLSCSATINVLCNLRPLTLTLRGKINYTFFIYFLLPTVLVFTLALKFFELLKKLFKIIVTYNRQHRKRNENLKSRT